MAGSPRFKLFNSHGVFVATTKYAEDAACLVSLYGPGAKIKDGGRIVWAEGKEEFSAGESYDQVAEVVWERIRERNIAALKKIEDRQRAYLAARQGGSKMAKYDWGFTITNKDTVSRDMKIDVIDKDTGRLIVFNLDGTIDRNETDHDFPAKREHDAEVFLHTMGWI